MDPNPPAGIGNRTAFLNRSLVAAAFVALGVTAFVLAVNARSAAEDAAHPIAVLGWGPRAARLGTADSTAVRAAIVFRASDCAAMPEFIDRLHALAGSHVPTDQIRGIVFGADSDSMAQVASEWVGGRFALRFVGGSAIERHLQSLGHRVTPVLLLFDPFDRLRVVIPPDMASGAVVSDAVALAAQ